MAVYIESLEKPKACGDCPCVEQNIGILRCIQRCRLSRKEIGDSEYHVKAPDWCQMEEYVGGQVMMFACDRKKECNTSPFCGTLCTQTFDKEHAVFEEGLWVFT